MPIRSRLRAVSRRSLTVLAAASALLAVALLLLWIAQLGRILPGTVVLGVDVGGRDVASARRLLEPAFDTFAQRPLGVRVPGERVLLDPAEVGLRVDADATIAAAFARGRVGAAAPLERLVSPLVPAATPPRVRLDEPSLVAWVDALAQRIERDASVGDLRIDGRRRTVTVVPPSGAVRIDRAASVDALRRALLDPDTRRVTLPVATSLPPTSRTAIETLGGRVTQALAEPLVLYHEGRELRVPATVLGPLLAVGVDGDAPTPQPELRIAPDDVTAALGALGAATFDRAPRDARIVIAEPERALDALSSVTFVARPTSATLEPAVTRTVFVPRRTARQLVAMVEAGARRAEADLLTIDPALTTVMLEERLPSHLLGSFTTYHGVGGARTENIRRLAEDLDGTFVAPRATFSINRESGPRSCADGYVPAGTIVRGELIDTCGGGVSQVGTTVMNAAFFAGLPLADWQPHSFYIGRYPAGREATLSYPDLDVRFVNDTGAWVLVHTATTPRSITVRLYGSARWASVRADHGEPVDPTPFTEVVRTAEDVAPGTTRVVQPGGDGFTIVVRRTRVPATGPWSPPGAEEEVERWRTVYVPQQRIVEINPADAPAVAAPPAAADAADAG